MFLKVVVGIIFIAAGSTCIGSTSATEHPGKSIYDFYCYQCHGYSGNGKTMASAYLSPAPRDFTSSLPSELTAERMAHAVENGIDGTGMVSFSSVLDRPSIVDVVDYIRTEFLGSETDNPENRYHTAENGWPNHGRYAAAFPFVERDFDLDIALEELSPGQAAGLLLFRRSCISCHDLPSSTRQYTTDIWVKDETPQRWNDTERLVASTLDAAGLRGKTIYEDNCAFCHALNGKGTNWIGRFLVPNPRDLTNPLFARVADRERVLDVILNGRPVTSMPAWRDVLSHQQIEDLLAYLLQRFGIGQSSTPVQVHLPELPAPRWDAVPAG